MPESMAAPNAASTDRKGIAQQCTKGWRKIHIVIDEETLEVRAIEVTSRNIGDAPMLPELLNQIPPDQDIGSVTAPSVHAGMHCWAVDERRSYCLKRRGQCAAIPRAHFVATLEWIPPPKPYRNQDALYKTARPVADGQGLRQAGRGDLNPHHRSQSLHGPWHTSHRGRRISLSGERGSPTLIRFVQQSREHNHSRALYRNVAEQGGEYDTYQDRGDAEVNQIREA
jgi:hypothetical protein